MAEHRSSNWSCGRKSWVSLNNRNNCPCFVSIVRTHNTGAEEANVVNWKDLIPLYYLLGCGSAANWRIKSGNTLYALLFGYCDRIRWLLWLYYTIIIIIFLIHGYHRYLQPFTSSVSAAHDWQYWVAYAHIYVCMWRDVDRWMYLNASESLNMGALLFRLLLLFLRESLLPLSLIDFAVPPPPPKPRA